jgi:geranylgeranyl transferase type-2 subunit beta
MTSLPFLTRLADLLRAGLAGMDEGRAARHADAVMSFRQAGGGFAGRRGGPDPYYTVFALRALEALGRLDLGLAAQDAALIADNRNTNLDPARTGAVDAMMAGQMEKSWSGGASSQEALERIERFRSTDGGYGRAPGAAQGSMYLSFLAALAYDLRGRMPPAVERLKAFALGRQGAQGEYGEFRSPTWGGGGTNATAAGMGLALLLGSGAAIDRSAAWLMAQQTPSGGWPATAHAPLPDLLSTFTALTMLATIESAGPSVRASSRSFAIACERPTGGFGAFPGDAGWDVEYTYYGLGVMGLTEEAGGER